MFLLISQAQSGFYPLKNVPVEAFMDGNIIIFVEAYLLFVFDHVTF